MKVCFESASKTDWCNNPVIKEFNSLEEAINFIRTDKEFVRNLVAEWSWVNFDFKDWNNFRLILDFNQHYNQNFDVSIQIYDDYIE